MLRHAHRMLASQTDARRELDRLRSGDLAPVRVAGFTPAVALESGRHPTVLGLVAAGHGAALVPASALANPPAGVVVRPLRPTPPPRRTWAVTQPRPAQPVAHFIDCLPATATKA